MLAKGSWQRNLVVLWIGQTMIMVAFSFFFPFIPLYVQTLGMTDTTQAAEWAGFISAGSSISMAIAQPIWGNLADRWGRKPMVVRSMLSGGLLTGLMGLAASPQQLLVLRFIQGGLTGTIAASNALVASQTPKHRLGFALGFMQVGYFVGTSVGPLLGGLMADAFGYRFAFYASGVTMTLAGLLVIFFVNEDFTPPPVDVQRPSIWQESRNLLAIAIFPILAGVVFMIQLGGVVVSPVLSLFVVELHGSGSPATAAGVIMGLTGAVSAVSALALGRYSDRIGPTVILSICLAGAALSYVPQAFVTSFFQLLALRMLTGAFLGGLMPSANALLARVTPAQHRGAAFGLSATASSLANFVGPLGGALVATQYGIRSVFLVTGGLFSLAFLWVGYGFRRQGVVLAPRQLDPKRNA
ncbi:MAG: MFS transporter [Chloroflexi bacterium]|nr:MFS transporter [Chloroflexota bacterium]MCL5108066.1 MFS transporter [Chloroflexota bacterium]